ncbi:MAG: hypothetical protein ACUVRD_01025 [Bacteroidia bacterium]
MENMPSSLESPSFEKVWLLIQETQKQIQETDRQLKETDRQLKETDLHLKETDRQLKETDRQQKETDRLLRETIRTLERHIKETDKKLRYLEGLFTGQWGKLVESLVSGDLVRLLRERGVEVRWLHERSQVFFAGKEIEIDIIAANGKDVVAVEVKTTLWVKDVRNFIEKLKIFKEAFPLYRGRRVYGAIAFIRAEEKADKYALGEGLYVIRATGKSATIINDKDFKPRVF